MPTKLLPPSGQLLTPVEPIERRIYLIRGQKVMLSPDLADLYQVETRALVQAVKRNIERFPEDFLFQLSAEEYANLKSQFVTSSWGGARRATPYALTELGVAMLSSVLRSKRAIQMNIVIMRAFVKLREALATHQDLARKLEQMEATQRKHGSILVAVVQEIKKLKQPPRRRKPRIGFVTDDK
jgi:hypothetical protein